MSSEVAFVLIGIGVIGIENEVRDFLFLLFLALDFLFEDVFEFQVLFLGLEEVVPIGVAKA